MPIVNLPNGTVLNFPEGMSDNDMRDAIESNFPEYAPPKGIVDRVKSALTANAAPAAAQEEDAAGVIDPMTGVDLSGAHAPAAGTLPGSVMNNAEAPAQDYTPSVAPLEPGLRAKLLQQFDGASPAKRAELVNAPGAIGDVFREQAGRYAVADAQGSSTPTTDQLDPRAEARQRRMVAEGMAPELAPSWATVAAQRGEQVGDEVGSVAKSDFDFEAQKKFNQDPLWSNPLVRGAVKGWEGYKSGYIGVNQAIAEMVGADEAAAGYAKMAKSSDDFTKAMGEPTNYAQRMFEGAVSSIAQQLPALLGGAVTGSEPLVLSAMWAQSFGQEYSDARDKGLTPDIAGLRASQFAALEIIGEKFGLHDQLEGIKAISHGNADLAAKHLFHAIKMEVPGEELTTIGQFGVDKEGGGIGMHTEADFKDFVHQVADTFVETLVQSGLTAGGGKLLAHGINKLNNGISPSSANTGNAARAEPTWAEATQPEAATPATAPAMPAIAPPVAERIEPKLDDITNATTIDDAIAAAHAIISKPITSPFATAADIEALEAAAGMRAPIAALNAQEAALPQALAAVPPAMQESAAAANEMADLAPQVWRRAASEVDPVVSPRHAIARIIDRNTDWHQFPDETGTLGVPRAEMPQVKAENRGPLVNFLNARGISHEQLELPSESLKPTQAEFSLDKVKQAQDYNGGDRSILVSSDNHVLDGHHQWLAKVDTGEPVKAIRLNAPIQQLLDTVKEFPSATTDNSSEQNVLPNGTEQEKPETGVELPVNSVPATAPLADRATRLTPLDHPDLHDATVRADLERMAGEGGWAQIGGQMLRENAEDQTSRVVGRTQWIAHHPWYAALAERPTRDGDGEATRRLVNKALAGEPLTAKDKRIVANMIALSKDERAAMENYYLQQVGDSTEEHDAIEHYADQFDDREAALAATLDDATIPLDGGMPTNHLSDEEIDALFGITTTQPAQADGSKTESGTEAAAGQGIAGTEAARPAEPAADFNLAGETPDEVRAKAKAEAERAKAVEAERAKLEAKRKQEQEQKEIDARQQASADNFQLGQSAEDGLSGQNSIFDAPARQESQVKDEHAEKWFGTRGKAEAYLIKKKISDTHAVKEAGKSRFEIAPKAIEEQVQDFIDGKRDTPPDVPQRKSATVKAPESNYGKGNKIFTEDAAAKARALLKSKLGQLNSGLDPEMMQAGIMLAGYHIEAGARSFVAYAKAMVADLGPGIKPYLRSFYEGVRHYPGIEGQGMTAHNAIDAIMGDLDKALQETAHPAPTTLRAAFYQALTDGSMPKDNNALRKFVAEFDGGTVDNARLKQGQEDLEAAIAQHARDLVHQGGTTEQVFQRLLELYQSQPNLNIRTSTSIENQAYSTPAPLAYIAAELAHIGKGTKVYEPTAGNGMLLLTADPKNATVNELESQRFANLQAQGFQASQGDALDAIEHGIVKPDSQDAIITNPPFGAVKDAAGNTIKVPVDGYKLGKIDHLIAANALAAMKDDGHATLILGADKVAGGISTDDRIFFNWLYSHYNVTSHFEVDGKLYARQGANWPVRVITVAGRAASNRISPAPGTIARVNTWSEVYEQFQQGLVAQDGAGQSASRAGSHGDMAADPGTVSGRNDSEGGTAVRTRTGSRQNGAGNVGGTNAGNGADRSQSAGNNLAAGADGIGFNDRADEQDPVEQGRADAAAANDGRAGTSEGRNTGQSDRKAVAANLSDVENQFQIPYEPRSARKDEGVLVPVNMAQPLQDALSKLEDDVGDLDQFARRELGYGSVAQLHQALMGLQVDSVASAIHNIKNAGKATIIADQTGIGKGRQAAAMLRWALKNGYTPVFISVKPQLFTDMHSDLADIGTNDLHPLIMNSDESIKGPNGEKLYANRPARHRKTLETIAATGTLPEGSNALFLTYSQINKPNMQRQALMALADKSIIVMDEAHNAAGESSTGDFVRGMLDAAPGVVYLSATYAKRPDNMPLYFKTDIGDAIADNGTMLDAMAAGGLPLQTVIANNLVKAGQMFRRERSYDGVAIETKVDTSNRTLHERISDEATTALRAIVDADKLFHSEYFAAIKEQMEQSGGSAIDNSGNQAAAAVNHTEFSSVVHNFIRQMQLGLKVDTTAREVIAAIERGERPLVALENTMGSFLVEYAENNGLKDGDSLAGFGYKTVLSRALDRTRYITKVMPNGDKVKEYIPLAKLPSNIRSAYVAAQDVIDQMNIDIPASPLDYIRAEVEKAGYSIAEITGRSMAVDYTGAIPKLTKVPEEEVNDKVKTTRRFNDGSLHAIILNVAGSTGISLHASEKFKDQRTRHMIVAQPAQDINIFMQMLGRIHRTGQVRLPKYTIMALDLPSEKRPTALLSKKMKSLNANTSSNTESATSIKAADMLNKYGDQIISAYLNENRKLAQRLDITGYGSDEVEQDLARKVTGRIALLPVKQQLAFYGEVEQQYHDLIDYLNKTNQNDLEPKTYDFEARPTREETIVAETNPASPFGAAAVYGEYSVKAQGKAMRPDEIRADMEANLSGMTAQQHTSALLDKLNRQVGDYAEEPATPMGRAFIQSHRIGEMYRIEINGDVMNAVVTNIRSTHKDTGNPFSMSKIQVTLALNSPMRQITVPASQWQKIEVAPLYGERIEGLFREATQSRDTAKIVTGNLLAAYGEMNGARGTIISFTRADGTIDQGILLPKRFDVKTGVRGDYLLKSADDVHTFLSESRHKDVARFGVQTRDGNVRVTPLGADGVMISVPKSKARGGKYFLDKKLTDIVGDFVSQGALMMARVYDVAKAKTAIAYLMKKAPLYASSSLADNARQVLNDPLPPANTDIHGIKESRAAQTESPAFKKWFGDSKVVDADGKPLVVYHGTYADKFSVFKPSKTGTFGPGIYFADSASDAAAAYGDRTEAAYLSLKNPWQIDVDSDSPGAYAEDVDHPAIEAVLSLPSGRYLVDDIKDRESEHFNQELQDELTDLGYDGVIATYPDGAKEYVAFRPEQIKSATDNNGNFDATNPDIRESQGTQRGGMTAKAVEQALAPLRDKWQGFTRLTVVDTPADLPARYAFGSSRTEGFYDPRSHEVFLIASHITNPARAVWTAVHEISGHAGLRMLQDKSLTDALRFAYQSKFVRELSQAIATDRNEAMDQGHVEEALAEMAAAIETDGFDRLARRYGVTVPDTAKNGIQGVIARVLAAIKKFLGKLTGNEADFSDGDVRQILSDARQAVEQGESMQPANRSEPVMSSQKASELMAYMREITDNRGLLDASKLLAWVEQQGGTGAEGLTSWLQNMGDAQLTQASVLRFMDANELPMFSQADKLESPAFKRWFGDSEVVDAEGNPLVVYHKTKNDIDAFADSRNEGQGFHFGTADQANMRAVGINGSNVMPVYLKAENLKRMKDMGQWKSAIKQAKRSRHDGIVYLNRFEGIPRERFEKLFSDGYTQDELDSIPDARFKKLVPEARDSYVVFEPEQIKSATGNNGNFDASKHDIRESRAPIDPTWTDPDLTRLDNVIHTLQDKHIDMKRVVQEIRKEMGELEDKWNPYLQEELFHGRAATGFKDFLHTELRPLLQDMQARGVTMEELEEYLHMRHAPEANAQLAKINPGEPDGLAGVSTEEAEDYLANLAPKKEAAYKALAARVDAITKETQKLLVDYGLESQNTIDTWNRVYEHYVPLKREDMDSPLGGNGTGQGFSVRGPASKRRMGSTRNVVDILANVAMARERAVVRGEKNRLDMALYGLALQAPNPEFWKPINPQKNTEALAAELDKMGLPPTVIEAIAQEPRQKVIDKQTGLVTRRVNPLLRNAPNVVAVRINGEDRFVFFNERNERAMRMAMTLKNLGNDGLNRFMQVAAKITRGFAAINTQYNPIFGIVNLTRDIGEGSVNLTSTPLAGKQLEFAAEVGRLLTHVAAKGFRLEKMTGADAGLWHEMQAEGGITGYRAMFSSSEDRAKDLEKELNRLSAGKALKTGRAVFDWLSDYNEALENVTRMAAYKLAVTNGLTRQQAASLAKNLTVNFNRAGAISKQVGSLYAFFNASAQGTARMLETLTSKAGPKIIAGGLLLGVMQAMMMAAAGFDEDEPPEFIRAKNLIIPLGWATGKKNYISIPMPQGFAYIPTISRLGTQLALRGGKKAGKTLTDMLGALLDTFNPIGTSTPLQTISPTATDPFVALAENKDWTGKRIAKEDFNSLRPTPGFGRTKDTASAFSKVAAYYLNSWTGGNKYTQGAVSPTPDQLDYLLGQFTGGVGREALKLQQTGSALYSGEDLPAYKVPLMGRFYGNAEDKSAVSSKFYENLLEVNTESAEFQGRRKDRNGAHEFLAEHPQARLEDLANAVESDLSALRKHKHDLMEKGADRARIKEIELQMRSRMEKFNNKFEQMQKKAPA